MGNLAAHDSTNQQGNARLIELADQCVKCGLCLPHCPTYALDRSEAESPRGRITMARALAAGELVADASIHEHMDHCLGCLSCQAVCPSGVRYGELIAGARSLLGPYHGNGLFRFVFKRPNLLRPLLRVANLLAVRRWLLPLARRALPAGASWRAALELLPNASAGAADKVREPVSGKAPLGRVALFRGCIADSCDAEALDACRQLLIASGFAVETLPAMCCGAIDAHAGNQQGAEASATRLRSAAHTADTDTVLTVTPGCLGTLRQALPGKTVDDAVTFLDRHGSGLRFRPLATRVALHIPCTQRHVARSDAALRSLLLRVPGLELLELPLQPRCCGAAGTHMLDYPERANRLRDIKLDQAEALTPERLLSGNIGCRIHLAAGWQQRDHGEPVEHPLTLLARQLETSHAEQ